jgi:citrate lyase beta subunit
LEDAVALSDKDRVRAEVIAYFKINGRVPADRPFNSVIRINNLRCSAGLADLDVLNAAGIRPDLVLLSKVESAAEVQLAARKLPESVRLMCLIETVQGVRRCASIAEASPRVAALAFGGLDLSAETGGEPTWDALLWPRTMVVHACAAVGILAVDQPYIDFANAAGLEEECRRTKALGFVGKLAIHPSQIEGIHRSYRPTAEQVARDRRIVAVYDAAGGNVANLEGQMIDVPIYRSALRVLQLAPA